MFNTLQIRNISVFLLAKWFMMFSSNVSAQLHTWILPEKSNIILQSMKVSINLYLILIMRLLFVRFFYYFKMF